MTSRLLLTCIAAALPAAGRADDLADLLKRVPGDMNTVAVINVAEINKTPRAVKEKWRDNHETEYLAGAAAVPAWTSVVVVGADILPGALVHGRSVALIPVNYSVDASTIAKRENGVTQSVNDQTLVLSPRRGYFGFPTAGIVAVSGTMPRQDFARWVRSARNPDKPAVSAYLQSAVAANRAAHVLIAIDLGDAIDPTAAKQAVERAGVVTGERNVDALVAVLASTRGLVFTATIGDTTKATLKIEFGLPMSGFVDAFKRLWPKAMEATGLEIEELKTAELKSDGQSVTVTADLSDASLRRALSLVAAPGDAVEGKDAASIRTPKEAAGLAASVRLYKAVNSVLDDLKVQGGTKSKDYVRSAAFFDAYAAKVEKLPLTDADPALVQYAVSAAAKLRAMAVSLRGGKMQLDAFEHYKSTTWAGTRSWGGGAVQLSTNVQEMDSKATELVARLEPERAKIWGILESDRSAVRQEMLQKYKIDFEQYKR